MAACSSAPATTPIPTLALIPATATYTPSPEPPTPTLEPFSQPQELFSSPTMPPAGEHTPEALIEVDPIAAELVSIAQRLVAQDLDLPTRRVRLVELQPYVWSDSSLGCPLPGQRYVAIVINGYRIVVSAGDENYIFHTDFDRVIPCDSDNEQLPIETTPEVTAEVTVASTPEATDET
jgi:hypothetical protein